MTYLVFGQPIRQPVHLHSDGRKRSHLRYPLTARTRNTQANNNFRLPDIDTSTPADHHILSSLRPPNPFPAVQPGGITRVNDAVRRAQSKQFAVPNATPSSVFTSDSRHQETPSSAGATTHDSHSFAAAVGPWRSLLVSSLLLCDTAATTTAVGRARSALKPHAAISTPPADRRRPTQDGVPDFPGSLRRPARDWRRRIYAESVSHGT